MRHAADMLARLFLLALFTGCITIGLWLGGQTEGLRRQRCAEAARMRGLAFVWDARGCTLQRKGKGEHGRAAAAEAR